MGEAAARFRGVRGGGLKMGGGGGGGGGIVRSTNKQAVRLSES